MKKVYFLSFLLIVILFPSRIKAYCSDDMLNNYVTLSNNINYYYTYKESNDTAIFNITFNNLYGRFVIENTSDGNLYYKGDNLTINNFKSGKEYVFNVYPSNVCSDRKVRTIHVKFPNYNKYYKNELCNGIEKYKLCQKWQEVNISLDKFEKQVDEYKESIKPSIEEQPEETETLLQKVRYYLIKIYTSYYFIFLPFIIISLVIIIYKLDQKDRIL